MKGNTNQQLITKRRKKLKDNYNKIGKIIKYNKRKKIVFIYSFLVHWYHRLYGMCPEMTCLHS